MLFKEPCELWLHDIWRVIKHTLPRLNVVWGVAVREVTEVMRKICKLQELLVLNGGEWEITKNGYFNGRGVGVVIIKWVGRRNKYSTSIEIFVEKNMNMKS